jgi:hypothetical protein
MALVRSSSSVSTSASPVPSATTSPSASKSPYPSTSASPSPAPQEPSIDERVSDAFERLSASAAALNVVSDELSKPIAAIDSSLKTLNLGVTTWVEFAGHVDHDAGCFWERSMGYAKVSGKWGIAIRTKNGDFGNEPDAEYWPFSEAPRAYRLEAVDKLPELIEKLVAAADETADKLKEKISTTNQVARAIAQSPAAIKDAVLAEIRKGKPVFHNTVVAQAKAIELSHDELIFHLQATQPKLVSAVEQNSGWLEELVRRVASREITVSVKVIPDAAKK